MLPDQSSSEDLPSFSQLLSELTSTQNHSRRTRPHSISSSGSESSPSSRNEGTTHCHRRARLQRKPKRASSLTKQQNPKTQAKSSPNPNLFDRFRKKILADDPHAEFDSRNQRSVRCSCCSKWISMRVLYDVRRWKDHRNSEHCRKMQLSKSFTKSLNNFFYSSTVEECATSTQVTHLRVSEASTSSYPCPGLSAAAHDNITSYLARTSSAGGGAPTRKSIALSLFPKLDAESYSWPSLTLTQQRMVLRREELQYKWLNQRSTHAIFSSSCLQNIPGTSEDNIIPCLECNALWKLPTFRTILRRKTPDEKNMKYVPKAYRCPELGTIYLKYHGVRDLMEKVCYNTSFVYLLKSLNVKNLGRWSLSMVAFCSGCGERIVQDTKCPPWDGRSYCEKIRTAFERKGIAKHALSRRS